MRRNPQLGFLIIAVVLALAIAAGLIFLTNLNALLVYLIAVNIVLFVFYGYDKSSAKAGGLRIPEIVLHALALAGGFAGGWAGMFVFRHKTQHPVFKYVLAAATVIWLVVFFVSFF